MSGRLRSATGHRREIFNAGWELASSAPGEASAMHWRPIAQLNTVAALETSRDFDAQDWWYRLRFRAAAHAAAHAVLGFDGLATVADVWLNGHAILSSDNMFVSHEIPVDKLLSEDNELTLRFRSLDTLLAAKRPRPRWRTPMVEQQQLRWFRTTLLGRTPGWSPPFPPIGPWRPIWLETREFFSIGAPQMRAYVCDGVGHVEIECAVSGMTAAQAQTVSLIISHNGTEHAATLRCQSNAGVFRGQLKIDAVELWWPHTHGAPALYAARLEIMAGQQTLQADLGNIGFRTIALETSGGDFGLRINGERIFCRGACWTPLDCVSLQSAPAAIDAALAQVAAAGLNLLRVGGAMVYESDAFLDACDAQGILLWQDFMFANMDYPEGDAAFDASVSREAQQILQRLAGRPSLALLCGNSEGEQQAAMWGASRERWSHPLFHRLLRERAQSLAADIPYWPSSAHGGAFPHQSSSGTTSYYGVGAYRRPLTDARLAEVRFATECLGFANVPEETALAAMPGGPGLKVHHPQWKARSPRDLGAGWDFDDIRDHYLAELFGTPALDLRYSDHARYLDLSRVVTGEVMAAVFREWRRARSTCNGALVWFLRDLWPGAGWGVVDALGTPKAPYFFLRRLLQSRAIFLSDEGVNGLFVHLANDTAQSVEAQMEIALYRSGEISLGTQRRSISIPARETLELPVATLFEGFMDLSYAYRFGPPPCDLVTATLTDGQGEVLGRDCYFPTGYAFAMEQDVGLEAGARLLPDGHAELSIRSKRLARYVTVQVEGFEAEDQYFNIAPGTEHRVRLSCRGSASMIRGRVRALNSAASCRIAAL